MVTFKSRFTLNYISSLINSSVSRFQLSNGFLAPKYQVFSLDNVPKSNFSYTDESGKIDSKLDFRYKPGLPTKKKTSETTLQNL